VARSDARTNAGPDTAACILWLTGSLWEKLARTAPSLWQSCPELSRSKQDLARIGRHLSQDQQLAQQHTLQASRVVRNSGFHRYSGPRRWNSRRRNLGSVALPRRTSGADSPLRRLHQRRPLVWARLSSQMGSRRSSRRRCRWGPKKISRVEPYGLLVISDPVTKRGCTLTVPVCNRAAPIEAVKQLTTPTHPGAKPLCWLPAKFSGRLQAVALRSTRGRQANLKTAATPP